MSNKKSYIVMAKGYEYDDNIYEETDGGSPQLVCFTKEAAEAEVRRKNIESFLKEDIQNYTWGLKNVLNVDEETFEAFQKEMYEKHGDNPDKGYSRKDNFYARLHPKCTEDEIDTYLSMVAMSFYEMVEVDIDIASFREDRIDEVLG